MLRRLSAIGYSAALVTAPAWLSACSPAADDTATAEEPTVLFSLTSDAMRLENASGSNVTLVMDGVDPHAIWFTDRPARESGTITTDRLADEWTDGGTFAEDPPNAALVLHETVATGEGVAETLVAEVLDAQYDAAASELRADLRVLSQEEVDSVEGQLAGHAARHDVAWPDSAGQVSLFIDSVTLCTTPASCQQDPSKNYTYNSTIYFQSTISDNGIVPAPGETTRVVS